MNGLSKVQCSFQNSEMFLFVMVVVVVVEQLDLHMVGSRACYSVPQNFHQEKLFHTSNM